MRASGNGSPAVCVDNLLRTMRGEVPFERVKGLDPRMIDRPLLDAEAGLQQDAEWLLSTFEPRVTVDAIHVLQSNSAAGGFAVKADVRERMV